MLSLRRERLAVFAYSDQGSEGLVHSAYYAIAERWGRLEHVSGNARTVGSQVTHEVDAIAHFPADVQIPQSGMIMAPDGRRYRILAVLNRTALRELLVHCGFTDDATLQLLFPGDATLTQTNAIDAVGGQTFRGDAALTQLGADLAGSGGLVFAGDATAQQLGAAVAGAGGVVFAGDLTLEQSAAVAAMGAQTFRGDVGLVALASIAAAGGLTFKGDATLTAPAQLDAVGGLQFTAISEFDSAMSMTQPGPALAAQGDNGVPLQYDATKAAYDTMAEVGATTSRASTGTYRDSNGVLQVAAANVVRDAHYVLNPVSGLYEKSTRLEAQRTNIIVRSQELDNASWSKIGASVTADAAAAPDGTLSADVIVEDGTTGLHRVIQNVTGCADNATQSLAVYLKAAGRTWAAITLRTKSTDQLAYVNLSTGALGSVTAGLTARVSDAGGGWWRVTLTASANSGATIPGIHIMPAMGDGVSSYAGTNGLAAIYAWGAQWEVDQPVASSYIPTVAASVTRSADSASIALPASFQTPQALTLYAKFIEQGTINSPSGTRVLSIGNAGTSGWLALIQTGGRYSFQYRPAPTLYTSTQAASPSIGDLVELRGVLAADGTVTCGQSINGAAETVAAASAASALEAAFNEQKLWLNSNATSDKGFIAFLSVKLVRGVKTLAQVRSF